jgi:hypothetical protein
MMAACTDGQISDNNNYNGYDEPRIYEILEEKIIVGEGTPWELNGLLAMPKDAEGKVPAVVLIHGSGPSDMNGVPRAYPGWNTPFKDIAEYLAEHGIAVIRYDKRTYSIDHALELDRQFGGSFTVWHETIEDAVLAADILRSDARIDSDRIFIAGLSMGGMLAPRIHAEGGNFAGIISLAGSPRFFLEISKDQGFAANMEHIETLEGEEKEDALKLMQTYDEDFWDWWNEYLDLPDDEAKNTLVPGGGTSAYYWKDLQRNPASKFTEDITIPFLIMQGKADFQVYYDIDFVAWQELLAGRNNATFKLYEGLNHIFMVSTTGTIEEYAVPANVDRQVLADMAEWIKAN